MSEVARLLCKALELRSDAERAGGHGARVSIHDCSDALIEAATPLGMRRKGRDAVSEWAVVSMCGGVLTLFGEHKPVEDEYARSTVEMATLEGTK